MSGATTLEHRPVAAIEPRRATTASSTASNPSARVCISRLNSALSAPWDAYVTGHESGTIFHTTAWQRAVESTFAHGPRHLVAQRGARIVGVLPLTQISSLLTGRALVSVPYAVGGGVLADDDEVAQSLLSAAVQCAINERATRIDLRSEVAAFDSLSPIEGYVGFWRELPTDARGVLASLPRKQRAVVRHARDRHRLAIVEGDEHLDTVWQLYSVNMRRLGSINYPPAFFRAIVEQTPGQHRVSVVMRRDRPVAGLFSLRFRDVVMPYFHGCLPDARACGASHLAYCELMEWAVANGCRAFDFGRSRRNNVGSYEFKRLMGFEPRPLGYQRWTACRTGRAADLNPSSASLSLARRAWPMLPLWLTRPTGAWLSRHLPG